MTANSSCCSRVMLYLSASSSVHSPSEMVQSPGIRGLTMRQPSVVECRVSGPAGNPRAGLSNTHGARLIDSTPPATASEASPTAIARFAPMTASSPEPHNRFSVTPGTLVGSPASRTAIRATSRLSSPAALASPKNTSSMRAGSRSGARPTTDPTTWAARSSGRVADRAPRETPDRGAYRVEDEGVGHR